jgi:adenylosuccinate lyase
MREKGADGNDLVERLAGDERLRLSRAEIDALLADRAAFTGAASRQVEMIVSQVAAITTTHPAAAAYNPEEIL